jgi:hypothetical protein
VSEGLPWFGSRHHTAGSAYTASATCSTGTLVGGGGNVTDTDLTPGAVAYLGQSYPSSTTTWTVTGRVGALNLAGGATVTATAYAICAS